MSVDMELAAPSSTQKIECLSCGFKSSAATDLEALDLANQHVAINFDHTVAYYPVTLVFATPIDEPAPVVDPAPVLDPVPPVDVTPV